MFDLPEIKSVGEYAFENLLSAFRKFQDTLTDEEELGVLANGQGGILRIESFRSYNAMVVFDGVDENNRRSRLIQHYSQVSLQLIAVPKLGDEPRRIGF